MVALRCKPLGLLGWLIWTLLDWVTGDAAKSDVPRQARVA